MCSRPASLEWGSGRRHDRALWTGSGTRRFTTSSRVCRTALLTECVEAAVATDQKLIYEKVVSNIQETRARGAHVIAIATDGNEDIQHHANDVIYVPKSPAFLQAVLATLPLQLLAYRIARLRGLNVDQPRNLAKTVTVE